MNDSSLYEKITAAENNFSIKLKLNRNHSFVAHWHEHIEVLLFVSGGCCITCGNENYDVKENDLVFINSNEIHFSDNCYSSNYWCMHIHPAFFSDTNYKNMLIENVVRNNEYVLEIYKAIIKENTERTEGYDLAIKGLTYTLMTYLLRNYKKTGAEIEKFEENKAKIQRLNQVFSYISAHYAQNLSTASLADMFYLNEHYFCRLFKKATGQSVINYINRLRIEKAAVLLEHTAESITDVALQVGFNDLNYFSRTFKRYMNTSPVQYRKMLK